MAARRRASPGRGRAGAAAIEFAIVLPVLLFCVLGLMEFARLVWTQASLDYAVQAAARCAAINPTTCGTVAQIQQYAVDKAFGLGLATDAVSVTTPTCGVQVSAQMAMEFVVPSLFPYAQTLYATACYPT